MAANASASRILLWSLAPAALVLFGGLAYLLNVFGIYRYNLFIYAVLLAIVVLVYVISVGIAFAWLSFRR
jgi:hypothetical protein